MRNYKRASMLLVASFGLFTLSSSASAATYYVATTGSDSNSCTTANNSSTPKRTITAALACVGTAGTDAGAGVTVQVANGVYNEQFNNQIPSGSSDSARFILKSANPRGAILRSTGDQSNKGTIAFTVDSHFITIDGFVIDGSSGTNTGGITFSSYNKNAFHHIRISNNEIINMQGDGMSISKGTNYEIINNTINNVGSPCTGLGIGYCHGIYVSADTVNSVFDGNTFSNVAGYGLHIYDSAPTISGNIISNNIFHHNGIVHNQAGLLIGGTDNVAYNNVAFDNGVGISVAYTGNNNNLVYNNTAWSNNLYGFDWVNGSNLTWKNNLSIENGSGAFQNYGGSGLISTNNISSGSGSSHFVNPGTDFHLISSSTAIDVGTTNIGNLTLSSYIGSAPDVGAYEYGGTASQNLSYTTSTKFVVGDRVQVVGGNLNIRSAPATSGTILGVQLVGSIGTVVGGPTIAEGLIWWNINFDSGADGWAVENYLVKYITTFPSPTPSPSPSPTITPTPNPTLTPITGRQIGDRIYTSQRVKVRSTPNGTSLGSQPRYTQGALVSGPVVAGSYSWWQVNYDSGIDGWSAEPYLIELIPSVKFSLNQRVTTNSQLNVRSGAGTSFTRLGTQLLGAQGNVSGGPSFGQGYWWWNINYDVAPDGWTREDLLQ